MFEKKNEKIEKSSWEPENQWGCDVTNSQWILIFLSIISRKSTMPIKWPHKIIVYRINKDHICELYMFMQAFDEKNEF